MILTLDAHQRIAVGDIIMALENSCEDQMGHVVLYAIGKFIAVQFEDDLPERLASFLTDLTSVAMTCHAFPKNIPPERPPQ